MPLINSYKISSLLDEINSDKEITSFDNLQSPKSYFDFFMPVSETIKNYFNLKILPEKVTLNNEIYYRSLVDYHNHLYLKVLDNIHTFEIYYADNLDGIESMKYICTYNSKDHIIKNISLDSYFNSNVKLLNLLSDICIFPISNLVVSDEIIKFNKNFISRISINNPHLRSSFNADMIWDNILYPSYVFDYKEINLGLLYFNLSNKRSSFKCLPKVIASDENKFTLIQNDKKYNRPFCLYLNGSTKYIEDELMLNDLRRIIFEYIYENSHITSNYEYLSVSINHCKKIEFTKRMIISKIKEGDRYKDLKGIKKLFVFKSKISGIKVTESKATVNLIKNIESWLSHYELYTSDITSSFYLFKLNSDLMFKNLEYITTTSLPTYLHKI